jgi:hypothetical protein
VRKETIQLLGNSLLVFLGGFSAGCSLLGFRSVGVVGVSGFSSVAMNRE